MLSVVAAVRTMVQCHLSGSQRIVRLAIYLFIYLFVDGEIFDRSVEASIMRSARQNAEYLFHS